jgi:Nucleoside diphosphate kinase
VAATPATGRWPAKYLPKALLGHVTETLLSGQTTGETVRVSSPWDAWWACYRAAVPLGQLGVRIALPETACPECARDALTLASAAQPQHPDLRDGRPCGCLLEWAVRMRAPAPRVAWPPLSLTLALIKPGTPSELIRTELERTHQVLRAVVTWLTTEDTRRLYPEAYGADYVAARDAYLTSGPVLALVLHTSPATAGEHPGRRPGKTGGPAGQVKDHIRDALGGDRLRNHLHMPDNPGEALTDIGHLAGDELLAELYERYERERAPHRLAFYRTALGISSGDADRSPV